MRTLDELIDKDDSAIHDLRDWIKDAKNDCSLLPPSPTRGDVLVETQVTTHSMMGALVYETGGLLIDHGWIRILGSGHPDLKRTLPEWNKDKSKGFWLIADDASGGFFALNGGAMGEDLQQVYYWPPDSLDWEEMEMGYSQFVHWCLNADLAGFYEPVRWPTWKSDLAKLSGDECFLMWPPLWADLVDESTGETEEKEIKDRIAGTTTMEKEFVTKLEGYESLDKSARQGCE